MISTIISNFIDKITVRKQSHYYCSTDEETKPQDSKAQSDPGDQWWAEGRQGAGSEASGLTAAQGALLLIIVVIMYNG